MSTPAPQTQKVYKINITCHYFILMNKNSDQVSIDNVKIGYYCKCNVWTQVLNISWKHPYIKIPKN